MRDTLTTLCVVAICVLPIGTASAQGSYRLLRLEEQNVKWGIPELGSGAALTYAILDTLTINTGRRNCRDMDDVGALLNETLTREIFEQELAAAFAMWASIADLRFTSVDGIDTADVLIGAQSIPRGLAYADISSDATRSTDIGRIDRGLICLNPNVNWIVEQLGMLTSEGVILKYALAHEIGHLLGLDHPNVHGELMSFLPNDSFGELQPGDIAGVELLYGPRRMIELHITNPMPSIVGQSETSGELHRAAFQEHTN